MGVRIVPLHILTACKDTNGRNRSAWAVIACDRLPTKSNKETPLCLSLIPLVTRPVAIRCAPIRTCAPTIPAPLCNFPVARTGRRSAGPARVAARRKRSRRYWPRRWIPDFGSPAREPKAAPNVIDPGGVVAAVSCGFRRLADRRGGSVAPVGTGDISVTAGQTGQVFGIAIDEAQPPNIYLTATSAFGLHRTADGAGWMAGQWGAAGGPGSIWVLEAANDYTPAPVRQRRTRRTCQHGRRSGQHRLRPMAQAASRQRSRNRHDPSLPHQRRHRTEPLRPRL